MVPIHTDSAIIALLTGQERTKPFEYLLRSAACTKCKNSPSSRVNLECISKVADKTSARRQTA
jgi:hypothetical protein